jgi:hypothetical protein
MPKPISMTKGVIYCGKSGLSPTTTSTHYAYCRCLHHKSTKIEGGNLLSNPSHIHTHTHSPQLKEGVMISSLGGGFYFHLFVSFSLSQDLAM